MKNKYNSVVIGAGPNGYAAAITLARKGYSVLLLEGRENIGGGLRTAELTLPGFFHDVCSTLHPLAAGSSFFNSIPLKDFGLNWIHPPVYLAHPFSDGSAAALIKSIEDTADTLDEDKKKYRHIMEPLAKDWNKISGDLLGPIKFPHHPLAAIRFGIKAVLPSSYFIKRFSSIKTRSLFSGLAAHGVVPTNQVFTTAVGLILGMAAHVNGWPYAEGGSISIARALDLYFKSLGGEVLTSTPVNSLNEIPPSDTIIFDTSPVMMLRAAGKKFSSSYSDKLRKFKYGPGTFKMDFALSEPVPFKNEYCRKAGFIHLGGSSEEIINSENEVFHGSNPLKPFVLFAQPTLFDPYRAPSGKHIAYAYCHVPNGSTADMSEYIINQIERFAPGFRDVIIASSSFGPRDLEIYNPNYVGGDINAGMQSWDQMFTRPVKKLNPYKTSADGIYICSSSAPPGGGVHGLCGYYAALSAEKYLRSL